MSEEATLTAIQQEVLNDYVETIIAGAKTYEHKITKLLKAYEDADDRSRTKTRSALFAYIEKLDFQTDYVRGAYKQPSNEEKPPFDVVLSQVLHSAIESDDIEFFYATASKFSFDAAGIFEIVCLTGYIDRTDLFAKRPNLRSKLFEEVLLNDEAIYGTLKEPQKRTILSSLKVRLVENPNNLLARKVAEKIEAEGIKVQSANDKLTESEKAFLKDIWFNERPCSVGKVKELIENLSPKAIQEAFNIISLCRHSKTKGTVGDANTILEISKLLYSKLDTKPLTPDNAITIAMKGEPEVFKLVFTDIEQYEQMTEVLEGVVNAQNNRLSLGIEPTLKQFVLDKVSTLSDDQLYGIIEQVVASGDVTFLGNKESGLIRTALGIAKYNLTDALSKSSESNPDSPAIMFLAASYGATEPQNVQKVYVRAALDMMYVLNEACGVEIVRSSRGRDPLSTLLPRIQSFDPALERSQQYRSLAMAFELAVKRAEGAAHIEGATEAYIKAAPRIAAAQSAAMLTLASGIKEMADALGMSPADIVKLRPDLLALPAAPQMPSGEEPKRISGPSSNVSRGNVVEADEVEVIPPGR